MPDKPDRLVCLSAYGVGDDPSLSDSVLGVQVLTRWNGADPRGVDDLDDEIFDLLHGLAGVELATGVRIVICLRQSSASLGQDVGQRWSRSANYYVTAHRPSDNRI